MKEFAPALKFVGYLLGAVVLATLLAKAQPYLTPQKAWPDWVFVGLAIAGLLVFTVCSSRPAKK